jgi:hypothetical protein
MKSREIGKIGKWAGSNKNAGMQREVNRHGRQTEGQISRHRKAHMQKSSGNEAGKTGK